MQTVNLSSGKASFSITGPDVEPLSDSWRRATPDQRRAYWPILARWVRDAKIKSLEGGEDARGDSLTPPTNPLSREWYRITGREWRGPSMSPQNGRSRTQRYLAVEPFPRGKPDRIVGFWRGGFARILNYHALGIAGRGRPYFDDAGRMRGWAGIPGATTGIVRDVVGLSPVWTQWAANNARNEWERSVGARIAARPAMPMPTQIPGRNRMDAVWDAMLAAVQNEIEDLFLLYTDRQQAGATEDELADILTRIGELQRREIQIPGAPFRRRRRRPRNVDPRVRRLAEARDVRVTRYTNQPVAADGTWLIESGRID